MRIHFLSFLADSSVHREIPLESSSFLFTQASIPARQELVYPYSISACQLAVNPCKRDVNLRGPSGQWASQEEESYHVCTLWLCKRTWFSHESLGLTSVGRERTYRNPRYPPKSKRSNLCSVELLLLANALLTWFLWKCITNDVNGLWFYSRRSFRAVTLWFHMQTKEVFPFVHDYSWMW